MKYITLIILLSTICIHATEKPTWCPNAKLYVEKRICINPALFSLENKLLQTYRNARDSMRKEEQKQLKKSQRMWIKNRNRNCDGKADSCIQNYYNKRIHKLSQNEPKHTSRPKLYNGVPLHEIQIQSSTSSQHYITPAKMLTTKDDTVKLCLRDKYSILKSYLATFKVTSPNGKVFYRKLNIHDDDWGCVRYPKDFKNPKELRGKYRWEGMVEGRRFAKDYWLFAH